MVRQSRNTEHPTCATEGTRLWVPAWRSFVCPSRGRQTGEQKSSPQSASDVLLTLVAMPAPPLTTYTLPLTSEQVIALRQLLESAGFEFSPKPYTIYFAQKNKLSVAVYEKGPKLLLQGKGIEEFVSFELEPTILREARLGYEEVHAPEMFEPHFGIDESGKGD